MLIVEGPDMVGKTTFCKECVKYLDQEGFIYSHFTRLPFGFKSPQMYVERMSPHVVQDRFHLSEPVYAKVRGDKPVFLPEHEAALKPYTLALITADDCLIEKRYAALADREMYSLEKILIANQIFIYAARRGFYRDYKFKVDLWIHCTRECEWPTKSHVEIACEQVKAQIKRNA